MKQPSSGICIVTSTSRTPQWPCSTHRLRTQSSNHSSHITGHMIRSSRLSSCLFGEEPRNGLPDCQVNCKSAAFLHFNLWASEPSSPLDSLGLGMFFDHAEATYSTYSITVVYLPLKSHINAICRPQMHQATLWLCSSVVVLDEQSQNAHKNNFVSILCLVIILVKHFKKSSNMIFSGHSLW